MNEQILPIEPSIREQLTRRSAGRLPYGMAADVFRALDAAPERRSFWRSPRLAVAGLSLAVVAVLVATIAFTATRPAPAASPSSSNNYPTERAMTTAELAALIAGPALPVNIALVASVTIDVRNDVCPMNRYQTQGVVEGVGSQVCVVTSDVAVQPMTLTGTFAFRYLAPGYLGLLGEITPASSSKLTFKVADTWPTAGGTFLVEGWLGAEGLAYPCPSLVTAGDVLAPIGLDCPNDNWLSDYPSAPLIDTSVAVMPQSTRDATKLYGNARIVEAGGMRQIDSIDHGTPLLGVYVVRAETEQCPSGSAQDNRGCGTWRVLARLADVSVPTPTQPSPSPRESPTGTPATTLAPALTGVIGSSNRPLTVDELETLMVEQPAHVAGRIVIVEAPIPTQISCQSDANGGGCAVNTKPLVQTGIWAVSIDAEGTLGPVGQITTPDGRLVVRVGDTKLTPSAPIDEFLIVDGWLDWANDCDTLPTEPPGTACHYSLLTASQLQWAHMRTLLPPNAIVSWVQPEAYSVFGSAKFGSEAVHGLYLIDGATATILARLEPAAP